ncbi:recombinase family protein [Nocardioides sp. NPDC006273]|uniref:recombinase family protein n=1 Tax=Nocardioides sp. NPDC006273 TaxID=3155598 RepID=UPI0033B0E247
MSSDPEGRAVGVERQEADCKALAEKHGYTVAGIYRDNDVSASTKSTKKRPGFTQMVERIHQGDVAAVLAYSNSRLTRRVREYLDIIDLHRETGVLFRTVVSGDADLTTADGRGVALTLATWDQAEAERTSERVTRAKADMMSRGMYSGGPRPFGYESDGVTIREAEAELIRSAAEKVLDGSGLYTLAREWNESGNLTPRGNQWRNESLRKVLMRPRTAGLTNAPGGHVEAVWPAILDMDRWEAVRAILLDPSRRSNQLGGEAQWLLTGIAVCGLDGCGATVRHGRTKSIPHYRCSNRSCTSRRQDLTDDLVRAVIVKRLREPDASDLLARHLDPAAAKEARSLRRTVTELETRLEALATNTDLSEKMLAKRAAVLEGELEQAQTRLDAANVATMAAGPLNALAGHRDPGQAFLDADLKTQRGVVRTLVTITFLPNAPKGRPKGWTPGSPYFDPETVRIVWN